MRVIVRLKGYMQRRWHLLTVWPWGPRFTCCTASRNSGRVNNLCLSLKRLQITYGEPTCKNCLAMEG